MTMLKIDSKQGRDVASNLYSHFTTTGILGNTEMPEDLLPSGVKRGSLEHLLFITLTVSIDYQRDANALWESSRQTFEDPDTRYLYDPESLHVKKPRVINVDMQKYGLSRKPKKDADIWRTVGVSFFKKWRGNPTNFLQDCNWDSMSVLRRLKEDMHLYNGKSVADYPYLRGNKIGPLWLRMLRDNVGVKELKNLERVPIPVDIHVARASLTTGVVHGRFDGRLEDIFEQIRNAWFQSVKGLSVGNREMIALDVDEPLWHLSRYGCSSRDIYGNCPMSSKCEAREFCVKGKVSIKKSQVELDT